MIEPFPKEVTKENVDDLITEYKVWYHDRMSLYIKSKAQVQRAQDKLTALELTRVGYKLSETPKDK